MVYFSQNCVIIYYIICAPVAQWIRASVFGTESRGFESLRVYHFLFKKIKAGLNPTFMVVGF